jgi:AcrR family transcriptional regulator
MKAAKSMGTLGRPRSFDADKALDRALQLFWRKGYQGTSLSDLTKSMGINRPSLYAAFGDKQALFRKVLDRYVDGPASYVREALSEPTARAVLERLLRRTVEVSTDPHNPKGCLMVQGALACGKEADPVRRELVSRRAGGEAAIRRRFERAKSEGDLPANTNPADLARFVTAILHGMAVQAVGGATRAKLQTIAEMALRILPNPAPPHM